jgi:hypothetical protein
MRFRTCASEVADAVAVMIPRRVGWVEHASEQAIEGGLTP